MLPILPNSNRNSKNCYLFNLKRSCRFKITSPTISPSWSTQGTIPIIKYSYKLLYLVYIPKRSASNPLIIYPICVHITFLPSTQYENTPIQASQQTYQADKIPTIQAQTCTSSERSGLKFNQQIQATLILSISTIYCLCAKWLTAFCSFQFEMAITMVQRSYRRQNDIFPSLNTPAHPLLAAPSLPVAGGKYT